jgi:hypothetical protein
MSIRAQAAVYSGHLSRVIAIGDLNASVEALQKILRGLRVINKQGAWIARNTHLVQLGDIFNRGGGARAALELLLRLQKEAPTRGSQVTILLANHEVMTAMGNEAYCGEEEYLPFATDAQRRAWPRKVQAAMRKLYREHEEGGPILPLAPRVDAWKALNAPGRLAMRRMLGPRGKLGRAIRKFPVVLKLGDTLFSHSALTPKWARLGIEGLNEEALREWHEAPAFYGDLPKQSVLCHNQGPLWNRTLLVKESAKTRQQLSSSLKLLEAKRMVVGHTMTRALGGKDGRIHTVQRGRIVCIDVALGRNPDSCAALVIDDKGGHEWTPKSRRKLW